MLILNFTRPLTDEHKTQIEALAGIAIDDIRMVPVQIDQVQPVPLGAWRRWRGRR